MSKLDINTEIKIEHKFKDSRVNGSCDLSELINAAVSDINGAGCECVLSYSYTFENDLDHECESYLISEYVDGAVQITIDGIDADFFVDGEGVVLNSSDIGEIYIDSITNIKGGSV